MEAWLEDPWLALTLIETVVTFRAIVAVRKIHDKLSLEKSTQITIHDPTLHHLQQVSMLSTRFIDRNMCGSSLPRVDCVVYVKVG
jgi:hypothetical protein